MGTQTLEPTLHGSTIPFDFDASPFFSFFTQADHNTERNTKGVGGKKHGTIVERMSW